MRRQSFTLALMVSCLALFPGFVLRAEDEPSSGVARVSLIRGDVSTLRGDSGDWVAAGVNTPLVPGDTVATGPGSRTEIQLDHANVLRLDEQAQAQIADLTASHLQVQVSQGQIDFVILRHTEAEVEIDTLNVAIHPFADGIYRIQVNSDSETQLMVRRGEAEVSTAQGSTNVQMDQLITIQGTDNPEFQVADAPGRDGWDEWNQNRDREILEAESWHHTNVYYTGASDLDRHGRWVQVPGYDWCWTPYVDLGWVPYSYGRWVWEPYWGWTWVSYEPWGWAPYHYGRWFFFGDSWVWWPGPPEPAFRPVYAPAYVSFFGFGFGGRNWSFGFGYGYRQIGWLPVGPSDVYYPWSGSRNTYNTVNVTNITNLTNISNVTNVNNVSNVQNASAVPPLAAARQPVMSNLQAAMNNASARRAIITVPTEDFASGHIPRKPETVDVARLRQAQLVQGAVPAVPTRESLRPVDRPVNPASIPARPLNPQGVFTKTQPPAGPRPFAERAAEIQQMVQKHNPAEAASRGPSATAGRAQPHPQAAAGQAAARPEGEQPGSRTESRPGWRRFGKPEAGKPSATAPSSQPTRPAPAVREENIPRENVPASQRQPSAPPRREENAPARVTPGENPSRSERPGASVRRAEEPTRPGWHRFGEGKSRGQEKPEKSRPAEHKPEHQEKPKEHI